MTKEEIQKNAVWICEGVLGYESCDLETQLEAWAYLIESGMVWSLQGWFGRTASALIREGVIVKHTNGYKIGEGVV